MLILSNFWVYCKYIILLIVGQLLNKVSFKVELFI